MMYLLFATFSVFVTCSAHSRNCLDDFDLADRPMVEHPDPRGHQVYEYDIPHADEPGYWTSIIGSKYSEPRRMAWNRNFYIFGKFADDSAHGRDSTITAGLYRGDDLIYKTVINCEKGTWENWILNRSSKLERILHGQIDTSLTSCKAGDDFDLILKNDNFRLANWIFNAQALQHDIRRFDRETNKVVDGKPVYKTDVLRPLVKVNSKYSVYNATKFRFEATGKAFFNRLAFGQCDAWPKNMETQCQKVRDWVAARSKARPTKSSSGLGVFGNNLPIFIPKCLSEKYFDWIDHIVHADRFVPVDVSKIKEPIQRAYCCCINMKTGRILDLDKDKNCKLLHECVEQGTSCIHAYDPDVGREIQEEQEQEEENA